MVRADMEARLGADFSDVRIHTGDQAAGSAAAVSATAYTVGSEVVFGQGSFDPASPAGRRRLAHELVHVQQQRHGPVPGTDTGGGVAVSDPADSFELEAETIAASPQLVDGRSPRDGHQGRPPAQRVGGRSVQRCGGVRCDCNTGEQDHVQSDSAGGPAFRAVQRAALTRSPGAADSDHILPKLGTTTQATVVQRQQDQAAPAPNAATIPEAQRVPAGGRSPSLHGSLTGDPVPGYEQPRLTYGETDVEEFWKQLGKREKENKENAADFVAGFGGAIVSLWGRHVSQVMAEAGKSAGWRFFDELLKFVAIKVLEVTAATLLTPASVAAFEAFGKELTHEVAEIGLHAISGYAGEHVAETLQDQTKEDQIEIAKEDIDRVTETISKSLEKVSAESIKGLPDITPYAKWLSEADKSKSWDQLSKFRLPPLFPKIERRAISGIVAGVITGALDVAKSPWPKGGITHHDSFITVDGPGIDKAVFHSPFRDLKIAASGVPIRSLPTVPLRITIPSSVSEGVRPTAAKLMALLRGSGFATAAEIDEFVKASGEMETAGYLLFVDRTASGDIGVWSGSLGQRLYLYKWATSDWNLVGIASRILDLLPMESEEILGESSSRMATPAELLAASQKYLSGPIVLEGARALIEKHVGKLFPDTGPL